MSKHSRNFVFAVLALGVSLTSQTVAAEDGAWEFVVSPLYLWAKSVDGVSAIGGNETPLDLDFQDDILENFDSAFAIHFEASKDKLTWYAELNYARLDPNMASTLGPLELNADIDYVDTMAEAGVFWKLGDSGPGNWELLTAIRYYDQDVDVRISANPDPGGNPLPAQINGGDSWWNGVVGLRGRYPLSTNWALGLRGDYGYGGSDNKSIHLAGTLDYTFKEWGSFFVGYRYLSTDFDNQKRTAEGYRFDADQQGPVLGLNIHF